ncbi:hypothetical protein [Lysobacter tyrosinilyticus]
MVDQELEVSVRAKRWACVVDPMLALAGPVSAQLVQRLAAVVELWMVRGFWQALDSSEYYRRDPLAFWPSALHGGLPASAGDRVVQALRFWEDLRAHNDLAGSGLNWVSDSLSESALPDGAPSNLIDRYEALHQGLAQRADPHLEATETAGFFSGMDTLALAAALGPARILTLAPQHPCACLPSVCSMLRLPFSPAPKNGEHLADAERKQLGDLIVHAGATGLAWASPPLALAYTVLPGALLQVPEVEDYARHPVAESLSTVPYALEYEGEPLPPPCASDAWQDAQIYYQQGWQ